MILWFHFSIKMEPGVCSPVDLKKKLVEMPLHYMEDEITLNPTSSGPIRWLEICSFFTPTNPFVRLAGVKCH